MGQTKPLDAPAEQLAGARQQLGQLVGIQHQEGQRRGWASIDWASIDC